MYLSVINILNYYGYGLNFDFATADNGGLLKPKL